MVNAASGAKCGKGKVFVKKLEKLPGDLCVENPPLLRKYCETVLAA